MMTKNEAFLAVQKAEMREDICKWRMDSICDLMAKIAGERARDAETPEDQQEWIMIKMKFEHLSYYIEAYEEKSQN